MLRLRGLCRSVPERSHQAELKHPVAARKFVKRREMATCSYITPSAEQH